MDIPRPNWVDVDAELTAVLGDATIQRTARAGPFNPAHPVSQSLCPNEFDVTQWSEYEWEYHSVIDLTGRASWALQIIAQSLVAHRKLMGCSGRHLPR